MVCLCRAEEMDESSDLGYQPSLSSMDQNYQQSITEETDSFAYCRTYSETSGFSDPIDDNSSCSEPSPLNWEPEKSRQALISRSATGKIRAGMLQKLDDDPEALEIGMFTFL